MHKALVLAFASIMLMDGAAIAATAVSYAKDIAPIFRTRCATCHLTGKEIGGLALYPKAARATLINKPASTGKHVLLIPGKPDQSYVIMKLENTHLKQGGKGNRMPFGAPPLDKPSIDKLRAWIKAGAKDN